MTEHHPENHPSEHPHHEHDRHHEFHLVIDNRQYKWPKEFITGDEIKGLAKVDLATFSVWEITPGAGDDEEIGNRQEVDLKGHEKKFIVGKKHTTEGADDELPPED